MDVSDFIKGYRLLVHEEFEDLLPSEFKERASVRSPQKVTPTPQVMGQTDGANHEEAATGPVGTDPDSTSQPE